MARPSATDRLARILAMVPWIASQNGPSIEDVCRRFDITHQQLVDDLDVVFVVGLYPYTPESLIEVDFDDDRVWIAYTNYFERPLRLARHEGLALLAAGVAAAAQPGHDADGPLARGIAKVAQVVGVDLHDDLGVVLSEADMATYRALADAVDSGVVTHIEYFSYARNEWTERDIEPLRLFAQDGVWYADAFCRTSQDHRVFRLDRIGAVTATADRFAPESADGAGAGIALGSELARVVLDVPASAGWVVSQYPVEQVEDGGDGAIRITLAVSARPWLERLLLRIGPGVRVVRAPPGWESIGTDVAQRVLARYRDAG